MLSANADNTLLSFESIYERYFGKVYGFIRKNVKDPDEIEDLTHDVFFKLWQNRDSFSETIPADAQLLVIARQLVINFHKRSLVREKALKQWHYYHPTATRVDSSSLLVQAEDLSNELQAAIEDLPPRRRQIFEKSRMEGMSYDEIASEMAISRNTVESQMVKTLHFLRQKLSHFYLPLLLLTIC